MWRDDARLFWSDFCINLFYLADIAVGFMTSYGDRSSGDEIWSPKLLAIKYIKGTFILDFLSVVPFLLQPIISLTVESKDQDRINQVLSLVSLLKILRVGRIGNVIAQLNMSIT